jgi:hypothetical protein
MRDSAPHPRRGDRSRHIGPRSNSAHDHFPRYLLTIAYRRKRKPLGLWQAQLCDKNAVGTPWWLRERLMITSRTGLFGAAAFLLSVSASYAGPHVADASRSFAAAQTSKQKCLNTCRARYRDCRHLNQLPSSECRGVYQDCTQYTCTGLGPG